MGARVLYSSESVEWETPQLFFDKLDDVFHFQLDACATAESAKCPRYFSKADDALKRDWAPFKRVWMNPPYGRVIGAWMQKAYTESGKGCIVVCLVPARTDTRWWHEWVKGRALVAFVRGRLDFTDRRPGPRKPKMSAPFPNAVVIYGLDVEAIVNGPRFPSCARPGGPARERGRR